MGRDTFVSLGGCGFHPRKYQRRFSRNLSFRLKNTWTFSNSYYRTGFQDHQRQATIEAGNLQPRCYTNNKRPPAAVRMSKMENNQRILVYDLGGGAFDVSLVLVENGVVRS